MPMSAAESFSGIVKITDLDESSLLNLSEVMGLSLNLEEMVRLRHYFRKLGREPTETELQAMGQAWSEHCCYKSSKFYLKKYLSGLKTDYTVLAMEDDAGIVKITGDLNYAVKMESHNHPSAIEPYGGAATGVGGILRDVLCMGAQPVAAIDSLYLGDGKSPGRKGMLNTKFLVNRVVGGIRDYGNRVGIPTVAGHLYFGKEFEGVPLVNAGCIGTVRDSEIRRSRVGAHGEILILAGGKTGRDGIHGVNFASRTLLAGKEENKKAVQLGNPIIKEPLIHAILEANSEGLISGMKDLGGGGLSSAAGEMCLAGGSGGEINLEKVLLKESGMEPWEIWVSESQERMLISAKKEHVDSIGKIMEKWGIDYGVIGKSTRGKRMKLLHHGEVVMDLPLTFLTSGPVYAKPFSMSSREDMEWIQPVDPNNFSMDLKKFIADYNNACKFGVVRQYDFTVRGDTVIKPVSGIPNHETHSDGAVIRASEDTTAGIGITSGCNVKAMINDAYQGTINSLSRSYTNLLALGCSPHSVVDSLNFGNPDKLEIMGQFVKSVKAIGDFCRELKLPVVAGNVSFYNELESLDIPPTPNILLTGIINDFRKALTPEFKGSGNSIFVVGGSSGNLAGSIYASYAGMTGGTMDHVDLEELSILKNSILECVEKGLVHSLHDISGGGLALALLEMSFGSGIGFNVDLSSINGSRLLNKLYSESGNRMIMEVSKENEEKIAGIFKGMEIHRIGITGDDRAVFNNDAQKIIDENISEFRESWEHGLDRLI